MPIYNQKEKRKANRARKAGFKVQFRTAIKHNNQCASPIAFPSERDVHP